MLLSLFFNSFLLILRFTGQRRWPASHSRWVYKRQQQQRPPPWTPSSLLAATAERDTGATVSAGPGGEFSHVQHGSPQSSSSLSTTGTAKRGNYTQDQLGDLGLRGWGAGVCGGGGMEKHKHCNTLENKGTEQTTIPRRFSLK